MSTPRWTTADLSDAHPEVALLEPIFRAYGGRAAFCGPASTVKCHEDNSLVGQALRSPGHGRVLVVDGGGSTRCSLVGDQLASAGRDNGWAGVVVWGCIRDRRIIDQLDFGIRALATIPRKTVKRGHGIVDEPVSLAGVRVHPGDWIYVDEDGILVGEGPLHLAE